MPEPLNRTRLQDLYVESMMKVNPKYIDFVHAEMTRCAKIIATKGIVCSKPPRIVVSRKAQMLPVIYQTPNLLIINFPMIQSLEQLTPNFREAMASYAMQMAYLHMKDEHRTAIRVHVTERPVWHGYKTAKWQQAYNWFTE